MNIFRKYKNLWMAGVVIVIAILFIVNFSVVVGGVRMLWNSIASLVMGAMLAFVLNLILDPVERWMEKSSRKFIRSHARALGILISIVVVTLIVVLMMSIIIPNMINAIQMVTKEAPSYFTEIEDFLKGIMDKYPILSGQTDTLNINWKETIEKLLNFVGKGFGTAFDSTINIVTGVISSAVNLFVIVVFAIYVLSDKERFVRLYHFFCSLYLTPRKTCKLTQDLKIINESFKAFVGGEIIEAAILTTMCAVGMYILRLPYPPMISILVGVINMIPMVGAFIGGGIGAFIIFTVSPVKCLVFLIFLCVIQQIESNIFFPRIIGNRVGLPGIFVMITIVMGGSLFGIFGMLLGVPLVASVYKIAQIYFRDKAEEKKEAGNTDPWLDVMALAEVPGTEDLKNCDILPDSRPDQKKEEEAVPEVRDIDEMAQFVAGQSVSEPADVRDSMGKKAGKAIVRGLNRAEASLAGARKDKEDDPGA